MSRGRKRIVGQLLADKAWLALTIAMGGALLLLLVGTQILDWYWLVLLAVASLGVGIYQLRGRIPSLYLVAQKIDRRSGFADALSTAFYFRDHSESGREALEGLQRKSAEQVASSVDLRHALPGSRSRFLMPGSVLAAAAVTLFLVRYAVTGSLDLRDSMVVLASDSFFGTPTELAKNSNAKDNKKNAEASPEATSEDNVDKGLPEEMLPESMMEEPLSSNPPSSYKDSNDPQSKQAEKEGEQQGKEGEKNSPDENGQKANDGDKKGDQQGKEGGDQGKEPSTLDKLRDALANLMNQNKPDSSKSAEKSQQKGQQQKAEDGEKQDSSDSQNSDSQAPGDQKQNAQDQKGDAKSGKSADNSMDATSHGDKSGDKTLKNKEAEQAMGKISELMGKRAESLKGEVLIEVGQTKQQLKTQWSTKQANHGEGGGEVHRDEVPLMYQQYVEQYFEELRKTPAGGAHVPKAPAKQDSKAK